MSNASTPERTLVITIRSVRGLSESEAAALAEKIRALVGADRYKLASQQVVGSARFSVGRYSSKGEWIKAIEQCPAEMTAAQISASLGLSERQVKRYRALIKALATDEPVL